MTVSSEVMRSGPYYGNGVTTAFDYEFRITDETHLVAIKADASGLETTLTLGVDYTVTGVDDDDGGQVIVLPALATGMAIVLLLDPPLTQGIDLENQGAYYAETVERGFDLSVQRDLKLQEQIDRSLKVSATSDVENLNALLSDISRLADSAGAIDTVASISASVVEVASISAEVQAVAAVAGAVSELAPHTAEIAALAPVASGLETVVENIDVILASPGNAVAASQAADRAEEAAGLIGSAILYTPQVLTAPQQTQARANIAAGAAFNFVQGLTLSNNAGNVANYIDIAAGAAQLGNVYAANASILTKRLDAAWAAGNNAGGLDTGSSKASNSFYHGYALRKISDGSFDCVFSLSATAPSPVPSGYVVVQRLGAIPTDGSGAIRPFIQDGNEFRLRITAGLSAFTGVTDRALALLTVPLPLGIRVLGLFTGAATFEPMYSGATDQGLLLADGADINTLTLGHMFGAIPNVGYVQARSFMDRVCRTNTSAQIYMGIIGTNPGTASTLVVRGWVDESIPRIGR